jgi:NAD(P)-dependent dehydrogenase (short-subunit alcohol dehydrogenase family)
MSSAPPTPDRLQERLRELTALLEQIAADWSLLDELAPADRARFQQAVAGIFHPDRTARRRRIRDTERERRAARLKKDDRVLASTAIRTLRSRPVVTTPNVFAPPEFDEIAPPSGGDTDESRHCYICKAHFTALHHFYDQLCPSCAAFNYAKRDELADLRGRIAVITGARVKIGYFAGLKLLRSGAQVIVTTRFPVNAAMRYEAEPDFVEWRDRLEIVGLDLRHTPSVEAFCRGILDSHDRLDFIVNNACQTVRRPSAFYAHMIAAEQAAANDPRQALVRRVSTNVSSAERSQIPLLAEDLLRDSQLFPDGRLDTDLQQVDLRQANSWRMMLADVPTVELLEVQLVNAIAPFVLNARLKPLMLRTPGREKHIVNVSAVEGQFYRRFKTTRHPHTNMAKAALNMMTRTSAADYHADGIHMNSVDTGWITDEDPVEVAARKTREQRFHPPLDAIDGAARILDPIIHGVNSGEHVWGQFLKDYRPADW